MSAGSIHYINLTLTADKTGILSHEDLPFGWSGFGLHTHQPPTILVGFGLFQFHQGFLMVEFLFFLNEFVQPADLPKIVQLPKWFQLTQRLFLHGSLHFNVVVDVVQSYLHFGQERCMLKTQRNERVFELSFLSRKEFWVVYHKR